MTRPKIHPVNPQKQSLKSTTRLQVRWYPKMTVPDIETQREASGSVRRERDVQRDEKALGVEVTAQTVQVYDRVWHP